MSGSEKLVVTKASDGSSDEARIAYLLALIEPRLRAAFLRLIKTIWSSKTLEQLTDLILRGRSQEIIDLASQAAGKFAADVNEAFVTAARNTEKMFGDSLAVIIGFDQTNYRAVRQMQETSLRLIREISDSVRENVAEILRQGISQGLNPRVQAIRLRELIGLTRRQMQAVENFRTILRTNAKDALTRALRDGRFDAAILRSVRTGVALTETQIDKMVARYAQRYLNHRAEVIARTESLAAVHRGNHEMFMQAVDAGQIEEGQVERTWQTAKDERVRGSHAAMHGQKRGLKEAFVSGLGNSLMYPGDASAPAADTAQCRCRLGTRLKLVS